MILVDTSVWVDHLRKSNGALVEQLGRGLVLAHPFVVGELALGNLRQRRAVLNALSNLPRASIATDEEVLHLIEEHTLFERGIGYVDAHLLAATSLTGGASLWTVDRRLNEVASRLGIAASMA